MVYKEYELLYNKVLDEPRFNDNEVKENLQKINEELIKNQI